VILHLKVVILYYDFCYFTLVSCYFMAFVCFKIQALGVVVKGAGGPLCERALIALARSISICLIRIYMDR
jgi:hypothetical protein